MEQAALPPPLIVDKSSDGSSKDSLMRDLDVLVEQTSSLDQAVNATEGKCLIAEQGFSITYLYM